MSVNAMAGRRTSRFAIASVWALLLAAAALGNGCGSSRGGFAEPDPRNFDLDGSVPDVGRVDCISQELKGEPVLLAIIVLLDRSGSMGSEKWTSATNAISAFVDRPEVVGMKMGLQFFPPLTSADYCTAAVYTDLAVPMGVLPDNVIPIQQRLADTDTTFGGATPMSPALEGTISAMGTWLGASDPHAGAVILVTDGDPSFCGDIDAVASVASTGVAESLSVKTFAVGMEGATFSNLDKVAAAGGGNPKAFNVGGGATAQQALLDALESIRTGALSCEYILPLPKPEDGVLDLDSVEIKFTSSENDPTETIRRVENEAACGATTAGFYYDDPDHPTRIILCPATCKRVRSSTAALGKVDISLGCIQRTN